MGRIVAKMWLKGTCVGGEEPQRRQFVLMVFQHLKTSVGLIDLLRGRTAPAAQGVILIPTL